MFKPKDLELENYGILKYMAEKREALVAYVNAGNLGIERKLRQLNVIKGNDLDLVVLEKGMEMLFLLFTDDDSLVNELFDNEGNGQ